MAAFIAHPIGQQDGGILRSHHPAHVGPVGDRDRFVVAGQRPVEGQLEQDRLATDRREHCLAADPGAVGDGVDRGRPVALLDEQLSAGVDDPPAGRLRLLVTQRRPVGASVNRYRRADVLDNIVV